MQMLSSILLFITFILPQLLFSLAEAQITPVKKEPIVWTKMDISTDSRIVKKLEIMELQGISGGAKNDVFAVGIKGTAGIILHYDGDGNNDNENDEIWEEIKISNVPLPKLYAVWGDSKKGAFAVGEGGAFFPVSKDKEGLPRPDTSENLSAVWRSPTDEVIILGENGTILHYNSNNSKKWEQMSSGVTCNLNGIWGSASNNVFAVGDGGTVLHYNGKEWEAKLENKEYGILKGVWGSGNNIFVVGEKGNMLHSKDGGNNWIPVKQVTENNLNSIWGKSQNDIYAVGNSGTVLHYDGKKWSEVAKPEPDTTNLNGVWVSPNPHVYIVGTYIFCSERCYVSLYTWNIRNKDALSGVAIKSSTDGNSWSPPVYTQSGRYLRYEPPNCTTCWLQFSLTGYATQARQITPRYNYETISDTYMVPTSYIPSNSISGVISAMDQYGSYKAVENVTVNLYLAVGCEFPDDPTYSIQDIGTDGHYSFENLPGGIYMVEPVKTGCTFTPQYPQLPSGPPYQACVCDFVP